MKKQFTSIFRFFNLEVYNIQRSQSPFEKPNDVQAVCDTMSAGLARSKKNGFSPSTIIDLGAAKGSWSVSAMELWPKAEYLLFEPLSERKNELELLKSTSKNIHVIHSAAGKEKGVIDFSVTDDLDGSGVYQNHPSAKTRTIEVTTIDNEVQNFGVKPPFLIKFDTHGFELPILEGAKSVLQQTELIIMECYGFRISKNSLLLHEMCAYLEKLDFRLADIVDVMRRPCDEFFWQCDLFFFRSSHPSFRQNSYK